MGKASLDCEHTLSLAISEATGQGCPPLLAKALDYAVFPGGARVRPRLCLAVALANGLRQASNFHDGGLTAEVAQSLASHGALMRAAKDTE